MNFLNPFVLFGLFAASIPILLHLLNLRKLKTIEFSTLRFLKELQKTKIRRLKLKQIILLILRTLIIIFAVMAFARPTIQGRFPGMVTYAKTSAVILIDNSFSMDVSDEFGNRFNQAKNTALSILKNLKEGDEAAIINMSETENQSSYGLSRNLNLVKEEISKLIITNSTADLERSLKLSSHLLEEAMNINKEVYIISDCQRNIFTGEFKDSTALFNSKNIVYMVPIGYSAKSDIRNLSIDSLNIISRIFQHDKAVEIEARIVNGSEKDANGVVISLIFNNRRTAQRSIDIPAGEMKTVTIASPPEMKGYARAEVEIEGDALDIDNHRYFGFLIPDKPNVALVGNKNLEFLKLVLGENMGINSPANLKTYSASEFSGIDLTSYDIIILASSSLRQSDYQRLESYIKNGGSALIFADDEGDNQVFSQSIGKFGFNGFKAQSYSENEPAKFISVDKMHPLFEGVFKGTTDNKAIVESPKIYKAMTVSSGQSVINMDGGSFLSENRIGNGKVMYCAISPVTSWSNFPVTGLFPTIIYRSIVYLASNEGLGTSVESGKPCVLSLPKKFAGGGNFKIIDPNGTESFKQAAILPGGATISFEPFKQLGVFVVKTSDGKTASIIAVNPPASESKFKPVSKKEIIQILEKRSGKLANIEFIEDSNNIFKGITRARTGTELWQFFLLLALLCAVAEMIIERNTKAETKES